MVAFQNLQVTRLKRSVVHAQFWCLLRYEQIIRILWRSVQAHVALAWGEDGLPDRDRTCDPQLRRLLLYPTELRAEETQKALDGPLLLDSTVSMRWLGIE